MSLFLCTHRWTKTKPVSTANSIHVFTDGSFSSATPTVGGIGVYFPDQQYADISESFNDKPTNQRAELLAVLRAIQTVRHENKTSTIEIHTDSKYAIGACTDWLARWRRNGWKTSKKEDVTNQDILRPLSECLDGVVFHHVRAHTGRADNASINNAFADKLAKDAIKNEHTSSSVHSTCVQANMSSSATV